MGARAVRRAGGAADAHFRAKGWVVKDGLQFGCDAILYRGPPDEFHAEWCVVVADARRPLPCNVAIRRVWTWVPPTALRGDAWLLYGAYGHGLAYGGYSGYGFLQAPYAYLGGCRNYLGGLVPCAAGR